MHLFKGVKKIVRYVKMEIVTPCEDQDLFICNQETV